VILSHSQGTAGGYTAKYGFYMHVFGHPDAVIHQLRSLKKYFPTNPVTVMSDGGLDYSTLCLEMGCTFLHCPPANDRWHPWPFLHRLRDAALKMNAECKAMHPDHPTPLAWASFCIVCTNLGVNYKIARVV
jgi:hypothetical protein